MNNSEIDTFNINLFINSPIFNRILAGEFKNIIVLTGAGVSTNAGIPDYRSKNGLYSNMYIYDDPRHNPESIFSPDHPGHEQFMNKIRNAQPTPTHDLCVKLFKWGYLKRVYTQNIDKLHIKAGLPEDMVVEFHGNYDNPVNYGDKISNQVIKMLKEDFGVNIRFTEVVDLMIIMGTSLQVAPFCALPNLPLKTCPRILVDIHPENVYENSWGNSYRGIASITASKNRENLESNLFRSKGYCKLGKRLVTLRPKWLKPSRENYIFKVSTDEFSNYISSKL